MITCQDLHTSWEQASFIPGSVRLGALEPTGPATVGDANGDGVPDLMVKFDRMAVLEMIGSASTRIAEVGCKGVLGPDTLYVAARDTIGLLPDSWTAATHV